MAWITLAGHQVQVHHVTVQHEESIIMRLPCLAGEDVCRETSSIPVEFQRNCVPFHPMAGLYETEPGDTLAGWGKLSSDDTLNVRTDTSAWYVTMPRALWEAANAYAEQHLAAAAK